MKHIVWILLFAMLVGACGQSYEEKKRMSRAERIKRMKEDSAALKIAVMPTLDCLPLYVAKAYNLYDSLGADIRLKTFSAQMDCDTALTGGSVEGAVTDLVRAQRIINSGTPLTYLTSTNAYWQLISNRNARINGLKQLNDKMVAMTRFSATDLLADYATDSAKLKHEHVFKVQINDVTVRLDMILNNEMDAMLLTEPQAAAARQMKHKVLMDTRRLGLHLGVIVLRSDGIKEENRRKQLSVLTKAYNMAIDSINKHGVGYYTQLVVNYCKVKQDVVRTIGKNVEFRHINPPRKIDIAHVEKWLNNNN